MGNNLLDCFLELFFLVCLYDGLNKKEISYYLQLLFQSNSKPSKDDYLLEVFIGWKELNCSVSHERKQETLLMLIEILEEEMKETKLEKIRNFILEGKEDSKKLKRKRRLVSECCLCYQQTTPYITKELYIPHHKEIKKEKNYG